MLTDDGLDLLFRKARTDGNLGFGDPAKVPTRGPRLSLDEVCRFI